MAVTDMNSRQKQPDVVLLMGAWGALWGIALGMWGLAPLIVVSHHIRPAHAGQWIVVVAGLGGVFAVLGSLLALFGGLFLVLVEGLWLRRFRDRVWAYACAAPLVVIAAYVIESIIIHWMSFGAFPFESYASRLATLAISWILGCLVCVAVYRWISSREHRLRPAMMAWAVVGVVAAGAIALPLRVGESVPPAPALTPLTPVADARTSAPLLFVGLDGATWRALQPAIDNGSAPTFRMLKERGIHGTVDALWAPYWSGAAWSSILTGLSRDVTGVHEDLAGLGPGLPVFQVPLTSGLALNPIYAVRSLLAGWGLIRFAPPPRALLNGTPAWELLHRAGVDSAVVRFRFTYPPEGQAHVLVSDWIGDDQWTEMGIRRSAADAVTPRDRAEELIALFSPDAPSDGALVADILPGPKPPQPADMKKDPIAELRLSLDIDGRTFEAAEAIVKSNQRQPFLAVYIGGLDSVEHAFWQYSFPEDFPADPPARQDVARLGHVLGRYVEYVDRRLSRLLSRYKTAPNVLIVSDHGMGPTTISSDFRGWHAKEGIFLLAGPSVPRDNSSRQVSYYDVLPTILQLKQFEKPEALRGKSVLAAAEGCAAGHPDGESLQSRTEC